MLAVSLLLGAAPAGMASDGDSGPRVPQGVEVQYIKYRWPISAVEFSLTGKALAKGSLEPEDVYEPCGPAQAVAVSLTFDPEALPAGEALDLSWLRACPGLEFLVVMDTGGGPKAEIALDSLPDGQALRGLALYTPVHWTDLSCLARFPNLEYLELYDDETILDDISGLAQLPRLTGLSLLINRLDAPWGAAELRAALNLADLESLELSRMDLGGGELFADCRSLRHVCLDDCPLGDYSWVARQNELESFEGTGADIRDLNVFSGCRRLECLYLWNAPGLTGLAGLESCPGLRGLFLNGVPDLTGLDGLAGCPAIETVHIWHAASPRSLSGLEGCARLEDLLIDTAPSLTGLDGLAGLTRLRSLRVSFAPLQGISALDGLTALREVSLERDGLTGIGSLAGCVNLRTLNVRGNLLTDIGPVAGMKDLEELDCRDNPVVDFSPVECLERILLP